MARRRNVKLTWRELWPIWMTFGGLFAFAALGLWFFVPTAPHVQQLKASEDIAIPLSALQLKTPVLFAAPLPSGATTELFVERDSADSIIVAFSSCRRCAGAGHYTQAGQVFCRRCNQPMPRLAPGELPSIEKDCKHIPIPFEKAEGTLRVRAQAVTESYTHRFEPTADHRASNVSEK